MVNCRFELTTDRSQFPARFKTVLLRSFSPGRVPAIGVLCSMLVRVFGSAVYGVDAITISIEVNVMAGREYYIVGLPDSSIKESIQRVESAIKTNGFFMPRTKLIVNLAPADIRKSGSAFDLPIAVGVLAATGQLRRARELSDYVVMGELNLDGSVNPVKGVLPMAITAAREGFKGLIVPASNSQEAAVVDGLEVYGVSHLRELISFFGEPFALQPVRATARESYVQAGEPADPDFSDVRGQPGIKRALEIAAAGGHNAVLIGPPGAGKTMLAKRIPGILPPLSLEEALETTRIHSVAGKLPPDATLVVRRPFRSPHHSISAAALAGGGSIPQPGEISLAHNGVLFLDELPEFRRAALEVMRQPLEERRVTIARSRMAVEFPANFMLIAAMNPCPCGFYNHPSKECACSPGMVQKYLHRISGPLLDRIDLHVEVTPVPFSLLSGAGPGEPSANIRNRVVRARQRQEERYREIPGVYSNAMVGAAALRRVCRLDTAGHNLLKTAMNRLSLSARAYDRILRMSRTIADLAGTEHIKTEHVAEAIQYRSLDRQGWAG